MENSIVQDMVQQMAKEISAKKEDLIKNKLTELIGCEVDLELECKRRFPRIVRFTDDADMSEHYYWNDGSIDGLRVISFYSNPPDFTENNKFISAFNYK